MVGDRAVLDAVQRTALPFLLPFFLPFLAVAPLGCSGSPASIGGWFAGITAVGAMTPGHEIEQIYYVGVLDPQEQVPPSVYRLRVRGQASILSRTRFASGWVPAALVDSLGSRIDLELDTGEVTGTAGATAMQAVQQAEARLIAFGPEGFRTVPRDQRLVIVMGSSPEEFFQAVDTALGDLAAGRLAGAGAEFDQLVAEVRALAQSEEERLRGLEERLDQQAAIDAGAGGDP